MTSVNVTTFLKTIVLPAIPRLLLVLVLLAGLGILTARGTVAASSAYAFVMLLIGMTAVAGTIVLSDGAQPNTNLFPHLVIILALIAFAVCMGVQNLFTGTQITGIFAVIIGAGSWAGGSVTPTPTSVPVTVVTNIASNGGGNAPGEGPPAITEPSAP